MTIAHHFGRGKFYDLLGVRKDLRETLKHQLERHARVSMSVEPNPHLPQLYSCVRAGQAEGWWVIDRWIEGKTRVPVTALLRIPWPRKQLPTLMKRILQGLAHLHSHKIVLRELNPGCVLISSEKAQPVITDLEMAKLFDGVPTVRNGSWPSSSFRAPEVESDQVAPSADLFSWAAVLLNLATGHVPNLVRIKEAIAEAALPDAVTDVVKKCLSSAPSRRPQDCESVRKAISKWT